MKTPIKLQRMLFVKYLPNVHIENYKDFYENYAETFRNNFTKEVEKYIKENDIEYNGYIVSASYNNDMGKRIILKATIY